MSQPNQNNNNFKDRKIFVGGLAWRTTTNDLRRTFEQYGEVVDANVVSEGLPGGNLRSKGYGFVVFKDVESANRACQRSGLVVHGRQTNVNMAYIGAKNKTNQSNQNGLLDQAGPSHHYQNGLFNQAAWHQYQPSYQYPNPHFTQPYWVPYYDPHSYMYNVPCYSYSTPMMHHVQAYRMHRNWERMNNQPSVNISAPPNEANEEDTDKETYTDQEGEMSGEDNDIKQDVNDQELEFMNGQEDDTKQDVDITKQIGNGIEVTLQCEIVLEEEADENTPQENGKGHEENGDQEEEHEYIQDRVREAI